MTTPEIARLNPFDGLFLRAVHLQQIQLYTQALARALGAAGDPGVVYGYGVALAAAAGESAGQLQVQPGLAVDADGRILLSEATIEVDLPGPGETLVWRIDLTGIDEPYGQENSYGDICVDPCEPAVGTTPFVREVAGVVLTPVPVPAGLDPAASAFRNRVASWYFEQERLAGGPLIAASDRDPLAGQGRPIAGVSWAAPTGPAAGPVGVGLLLRTAGGFVLDVWAARRDRVQTPPETGWMGRLAMRPWQVFIAQLLQFQDQLGTAWPDPGPAGPGTPIGQSVRADVSNQLTEALQLIETRKLREPATLLKDALAVLSGAKPPVSVTSLLDLGFTDLPPAGYLPAQRRGLAERIRMLFPVGTGLVFNEYRADTIVELVAHAQHADRIPLTRDGGGVWPPRIEIMVPVPEPYAGGGDLQTTRSWVAFRRAVRIPAYTNDPVR